MDPEGYKIEFEQFNPHPENELLMPLLDALPGEKMIVLRKRIFCTIQY